MPAFCWWTWSVSVLLSKVRTDSASKVLAVPEPVIILLSALLFIVVPVTVSNVGSAPLFARKNLPSLLDVPWGSLDKATAWSAIALVSTALSASSLASIWFAGILVFVMASS